MPVKSDVSSKMSMYVGAPTDKSVHSQTAKRHPMRKERIKPPSTLQKIFRCRNQPNSQYYMTHALSVNPSDIKNEPDETFKVPESKDPFWYKVFQKKQKKKMYEENRAKKHYETRKNADMLKRLYIEDPEVKGPVTILDMDPQFYTLVEGRPIQSKFRMSQYMEDIRNVLRTKLMLGFRQDEIINIEMRMKTDQEDLGRVSNLLKIYSDKFDAFLSDDYEESVSRLREAELESQKNMDMIQELRDKYIELARVEFDVYKLEERWRDLKMYQKFLYCVSPMAWREEHDHIHKDRLYQIGSDETGIFNRDYIGEMPPLEELVDDFLETIKHEPEPKLYFTEPKELFNMFRSIEVQSLNSLLHTEDITGPLQRISESLKKSRQKYDEDNKEKLDTIKSLEISIEWEETRVAQLKETAMNLIDVQLKALVSDEEILKLYVHVEEVYETCIRPNDTNMNLYEMMSAIESLYHMLILESENIPREIVMKSAQIQHDESKRLKALQADTAKKLTLVERITKRLKKSLDPPVFRTQKELKQRSEPPKKIVRKPKLKRKLTEAERDYLAFFTAYCQYTDQVEDYGIDLTKGTTKGTALEIVKERLEQYDEN